ncbi:IS5 family transposase [Novosphingobium sp. Chol11]|uniref:IS5 family transposase n=1 Tax=Novosphingobium sp. Chol11 TaxID=1385763 RepID=UPI0025E82B44|nr:IS5 family transposase [Novosphingobium sp. Chol11]
MDVPFLLSEAQMRRIEPFFPLSHGVPRVDDRRIVSGIIYVIKHGLMWRDAPKDYGPHKTIYNRFIRWSRLGVFNRIFAELAGKAGEPDRIMIDATHLKAHRTAASLFKRGALSRCIGRTKGGLNSKLHAVCDGLGRPIMMLLTEGQMSDHKGAFLLLSALPNAKELLADKGYDSDWFRAALVERGITPCIPPRSNRKVQYHYDKALYRQRHKIENVFGRIKDWRRVATRYDRCAHTFMSAISIAATCCYWL